MNGSGDHSSQLLFLYPRLQAGLGAAPPAADYPGRWLDQEQLAAWSSQHSQDLIVANRQMGLTKARVPGSREGWPTTFHLCGGKVASVSLKRGCLGGPGAKGLCFQCLGLRLDPQSGNYTFSCCNQDPACGSEDRTPHALTTTRRGQKPEKQPPQNPRGLCLLSSALPLAPCCVVRTPANARIGGYFRGLGAGGPILENQRLPCKHQH